MKKLIILFVFIFSVSFCVYSQNKHSSTTNNDDVTITINVSKINKILGKVVNGAQRSINYISSEIEEFVNDIPEEEKEKMKEVADTVKSKTKYEAKYARDAIHAGWRQGWRGESYSPPYKHR